VYYSSSKLAKCVELIRTGGLWRPKPIKETYPGGEKNLQMIKRDIESVY